MSDDIGDVYIGIGADASGFTEEVEAKADEAGLSGGAGLARALGAAFDSFVGEAIKPGLDEIKAEVDILIAEIAHGPMDHLDLNIHAETEAARLEIDGFVESLKSKAIDLKANLDDSKAKAELGIFLRSRVITIIPKIAAGAGNALKSAAMPMALISTIGPAIGAAADLALTASQGILGVAASVMTMLPAVLTLPGVLMSAAGAAGVFVIAMKGASTALASLKPEADSIATGIQKSFWDQATTPIKEGFQSLQPAIKSVFDGISTDLGSFTGKLASAFSGALGGGGLASLFSGVGPAISILDSGIKPFVNDLMILGQLSQQYLPQMAQWIVDIGGKFSTWLAGVNASGALKDMVSAALTQFKLLFSAVGSVLSIVNGLITAATKAGTGGLSTLASGLSAIAKIVNGPAFQTTLSQFFYAATLGASDLLPALTGLGKMFDGLSGSLSIFLAGAGQAVGGALTAIFKALNQPAVGAGLVAAIQGIQKGFAAIEPILPIVMANLAPILNLFGTLAGVVGPLIAGVLKIIAPLFGDLVKQLTPLAQTVGSALMKLLPIMQQAFSNLGKALPPLSAALTPILTGIIGFAGWVLKLITPLLKMPTLIEAVVAGFLAWKVVMAGINLGVMIADLAKLAIGFAVEGVAEAADVVETGILMAMYAADAIATTAVTVATAAYDVVMAIATAPITLVILAIGLLIAGIILLITHWSAVTSFISTVWTAAVNWVTSTVKNLVNFWGTAWADVLLVVTNVFNAIVSFISNYINQALAVVRGVLGFIVSTFQSEFNAARNVVSAVVGAIVGFVQNMASGIGNAIGTAVNWFLSLGDRIRGAISGAESWLVSTGKNIIQGLINGITSVIGNVAKTIQNGIGGAVNGLKSFLGIKSPSKLFHDEIGVMIGKGLANGVASTKDLVKQSMQDLIALPTLPGFGGTGGGIGIPGGSMGSGYGHSANVPGMMGGTTVNFNQGAIGIAGVGDPNRAAQEVVNRVAMRVGL